MKSTTTLLAAAGFTGIMIAGTITGHAAAWHPQGTIKKYVQNQTAGGEMKDANDADSAISAKPGDLLKYTVVIENKGAADDEGMNDMAKTTLTDTLPAGVELVINTAQRTITEDLGLVKPGQKVTKEYVVKVTSDKDGDILDNKACFTGDSTNNDAPQQGCENAIVKVSNPKKEETPTPTPTSTETPKEETPAKDTPKQEVQGAATEELASTGPANALVPAGIVTGLGYAGNMLRLKRRAARENR